MAYFEIADFKGGLDVRRSRYTSVPGTLQKLVNAHITRGGDVERRKAFVNKGYFAANTFDLAADEGGLVTFGSDAAPYNNELPAGVRYQRLQAPSGAAMVSVDATEAFGGKLYVAATYDDGVQWHFYDGTLVGAWSGGIARPYMINRAGIAQHLADLINAGGIYTATRVNETLTITGPVGVDYVTVGTTENVDGGNPNQDLSISPFQAPVVAVAEQRAIASFTIFAGIQGSGNEIARITVNPDFMTPIQLLSAPVAFTEDAKLTAVAVASAINGGGHGFRARAEYGSILIEAPTGQGDSANGKKIEVEVNGEVCLADGKFSISGGANGANDQLVFVKAAGLSLVSAAVPWNTSNGQTAEDVASAINSYASSPKYVAAAIGEAVYLSPKVVRSDDPSQVNIQVSTNGDFTTGDGWVPPEGPPGGGGGGGFDPRNPHSPEDIFLN